MIYTHCTSLLGKILSLTFFLSSFTPGKAQITFQKKISFGGDEFAHTVIEVSGGGYMACGEHTTANGDYDAHLTRTDAAGNVLWSKQYGSAENEDLFAVVQTPGGNYIAAGYLSNTMTFSNDIYVLSTDPSGNILWSKTFDIGDYDLGFDIERTLDNHYVITGSAQQGTNDIFLMKIDSLGTMLWSKKYDNLGNDVGYDVFQDSDSGFVVAAYTDGAGSGNFDFCVLKTDVSGNILWSKTYGGTNNDWGAYSVSPAAGGGYIIGGGTTSFGAGQTDFYLIKTDALGSPAWSKTYGGAGNDYGFSCLQTVDGGFAIAGLTNSFGLGASDAYLVKTDEFGNILWSHTYGTSSDETASRVYQTADGGFVLTGAPYNFGPQPGDIHIIKTDSLGNHDPGCQMTPATMVTTPATVVTTPNIVSVVHTVVSSSYPVSTIVSAITDTALCAPSCVSVTLSISTTSASCAGSTGTATATPSGGVTPYTYSWNNGQTVQTATGLVPGTYSVTVTGNDGCFAVSSAIISMPDSLVFSISSDSASCGMNDGAVTVNISGGGTPPYTYEWNTLPPQDSSTATGLPAATYTVTITDAGGCTQTASVSVSSTGGLSIAISDSDPCPNDSNGAVTVSADGGSSPYSYQWSNGQTTSAVSGLPVGVYTVTVSDAAGCQSVISDTLKEAPVFHVTFAGGNTDTICSGDTLSITASGGTFYTWSTGQNGNSIEVSPVSDSVYFVTGIPPGDGCLGTDSFYVTVQSASISSSCSGAAITLTAGSGTGYLWNTNPMQTSPSIIVSPASPTVYAVTVTASCGLIVDSVTIYPAVSATMTNDTTVQTGTTLQLTASTTTAATYLWSTGENSSSVSVSPAENTAYTVTVTDAAGCVDIKTIYVRVEDPDYVVSVPTIFSPNNDGVNDVIRVYGYGVKQYHLAIYDRWAEKVFEENGSSPPGNHWDGSFKGKPLNSAVFVYILDAVFTDGTKFHGKGNITLVR